MRAYYLDRIRIFLTILVIFHHTAIAFGASGGWYYVSPESASGSAQMLLSFFMTIDQAYFMSFFFLISALLMPASYERKGFGKFIKDRLVRLGIPLIIYILLIHPTVVWFVLNHTGQNISWLQITWHLISREPGPGPMWFVLTLLIFELLYAFYMKFRGHGNSGQYLAKMPSGLGIILFILGTGITAFLVRLGYPTGKNFFGLQFGYFPLYIAMYIVGIVAARRHWLEKFTLRQSKPWFYLSVAAILVLMVVMMQNAGTDMSSFNGGWNKSALFYAMWEPFVCVGFCFYFTLLARDYLNRPNNFVTAMSRASYPAYIIHPLIVVLSTFELESLPVSPCLKIVGVCLLAVPICFWTGVLFNRIIKNEKSKASAS